MSHSESTNQDNQNLFYNGCFYDLIFQGSYRHSVQSQDIGFWQSIAQVHGSPILELACGTGRVTADLAEGGFLCTGIDISESMLNAARTKSQKAHWVQGDVRDFDLQTQFSLIIFPYDTFTHLHSLDDVRQCLSRVRQHLAPGGHFIVDFKNPYYIFDILQNPDRIDPYSQFPDPQDGSLVTIKRRRQYHAWSQIHTMTLMFYRNGVQFAEEDLDLRIFWPQEIMTLLQANHFQIVKTWGDYQSGSYSIHSSHLILDCQVSPSP